MSTPKNSRKRKYDKAAVISGAISLIAGIGLISLSIWYNKVWALFVSLLWTMTPISLIYGVTRKKRQFYQPFILSCAMITLLAWVASIYLMVTELAVNCCSCKSGYCSCSDEYKMLRYVGPLYILATFISTFHDFAKRSLKHLDKEKEQS